MKFKFPERFTSYSQFRINVKTGDLLLTRASNNIMSNLHSIFLNSPVSHVGIAVVSSCKDVLIFEAGPRGAQLRGLLDYMREGADHLWWRPIKENHDLLNHIESFSKSAYSLGFLLDLPRELLGIESPGLNEDTEIMANSCGDLVAKVYEKAGFLSHSKRRWFPMNFLDDSTMPWTTKVLDEIQTVIIDDYKESDYECAQSSLVDAIYNYSKIY